MRKYISSILFIIFLFSFSGCWQDPIGPDKDGITRFQIEGIREIRFEYDWRTSRMTGINTGSTGGSFVFKIKKFEYGEREGNRLNLGPGQEDSFIRNYENGVRLEIEWRYDGLCGTCDVVMS